MGTILKTFNCTHNDKTMFCRNNPFDYDYNLFDYHNNQFNYSLWFNLQDYAHGNSYTSYRYHMDMGHYDLFFSPHEQAFVSLLAHY